jgi:two-component system, sensor histidine kinase and response regulator
VTVSATELPTSNLVTCLVVDDLEENLFAMAALLSTGDVRVLTARSGTEALELLLVNEVALALLDVQMPGMDGLELAELMRGSERTRDVPIIFITAGTHDKRRVFKGYEAGAVDFIHKPVDVHAMRNKAAVFFDIHRRKRQMAAELRERAESLRMNEMFVAVLAHDLRNPLSAIVTAAELLKRRQGDPQLARLAESMLGSGRRMGRMINDLLDLVRARMGGGIVLQRQAGDLGQVVAAIVLEQELARSEQRIDVHQAGDLSGNWDLGRLAQVMSNLIGNALQHGEAQQPVTVSLDGNESDQIVMTVQNCGDIPEELREHLFDAFRGSGQGPSGGGLGLGLYITRQIVQQHGGSVELDDSVDGRTRFRVVLPRGIDAG